jgi:hypothetical protein
MRTLVFSLTVLTSFAVAQTTVTPEKQWGEIVTAVMRKENVQNYPKSARAVERGRSPSKTAA